MSDEEVVFPSGVKVFGLGVDGQTRCSHYYSQLDVVAIQFPCCKTFYSCLECHAALADHPAERWERLEFDRKAILCGACGDVQTIEDYLSDGSECSVCGALFNPGCKSHWPLYFEV